MQVPEVSMSMGPYTEKQSLIQQNVVQINCALTSTIMSQSHSKFQGQNNTIRNGTSQLALK